VRFELATPRKEILSLYRCSLPTAPPEQDENKLFLKVQSLHCGEQKYRTLQIGSMNDWCLQKDEKHGISGSIFLERLCKNRFQKDKYTQVKGNS
jgi:hypothetical protein